MGCRRLIGLKARLLAMLGSGGLPLPALTFLLILAIGPLFIKDEYILRLLVVSLSLGAQAMAFDFTGGFIGVVNFGFAAFAGLGAYTSGLLATKLGVNPWLGLIAAAAVAGIGGFFTGALTLRLRGIFVALMSWFIGLALQALATAMVDLTRGFRGLIVPLLLGTAMRSYFYVLLPMTVLIYIILQAITRSHIGLAFRAIGQNLEAARASGVNPTKYKLINFTLSCALAGLLGGYYGHFVGIISPAIMATSHTIEVLALSYIGGRGTLWGGLLAAFLIVPIFEYLKWLMEIRLIIYGSSLILITMLYPKGLVGLLQGIGRLLRRQRERLHGI